jgi:hypothetical protein
MIARSSSIWLPLQGGGGPLRSFQVVLMVARTRPEGELLVIFSPTARTMTRSAAFYRDAVPAMKSEPNIAEPQRAVLWPRGARARF